MYQECAWPSIAPGCHGITNHATDQYNEGLLFIAQGYRLATGDIDPQQLTSSRIAHGKVDEPG